MADPSRTITPKDLSWEDATDIVQNLRDILKGNRTKPMSDEELVIEMINILDEYNIG